MIKRFFYKLSFFLFSLHKIRPELEKAWNAFFVAAVCLRVDMLSHKATSKSWISPLISIGNSHFHKGGQWLLRRFKLKDIQQNVAAQATPIQGSSQSCPFLFHSRQLSSGVSFYSLSTASQPSTTTDYAQSSLGCLGDFCPLKVFFSNVSNYSCKSCSFPKPPLVHRKCCFAYITIRFAYVHNRWHGDHVFILRATLFSEQPSGGRIPMVEGKSWQNSE